MSASQVPSTSPPTLPPLALDNLPPPVREDLERASADARAHPHDASAIGRLAMMLHAYEQYRLAGTCYNIARRLDPQSLSWTYLSGVVDAELGAHTIAAASFRRSLEINPAYLPARVRLADALMNSGEFDRSRAEYEALVRTFRELALAHYGLGRVWSALGDSKTAASHYQRAVDAAPQFGRAHYALALAYRDAGLVDRAQVHLDAYGRFGPHRPTLPDHLLDEVKRLRETARDLIAEAARLGSAGRLDASIALHLKALEADPTAAQAHVNLIPLYGRTGQAGKAEQHYQAALRLHSNVSEAHYNYGVLQAYSGRYAEAAAAFRKTIEVDPFHAQAHNNLGALLAQQGKREDAAAHYRRALASDPQHRGARFSLGRVLVALDRPREAVEQFQKLLLLSESAESPRYQYALANAWFAAGDIAKARGYAADALQHARRLGQSELAGQIEKELHRMNAVGR